MVCYADQCSLFFFPMMNKIKWKQTDNRGGKGFSIKNKPLYPLQLKQIVKQMWILTV